jgi:hypothetical protein
VVELRKPGHTSDTSIIVQGMGERAVPLQYQAKMVRSKATLEQPVSWARNWSRLDETQLSFHGLNLIWAVPPSSDSEGLLLDAETRKFFATKEVSFQLRVEKCDGAQACIEDGDMVETIITVGSAESIPSMLQSEVRILTLVQSLLSCRHTRVHLEPDRGSASISSPISVRIFANDVDNLPVAFTRADIHLGFGDHTIPMQWSRGSSVYFADVPTERPGSYELVVSARTAWNETAGQATTCELLRRTITVKERLSTNAVLAGAGGAALVLVAGIVIFVRKRHAHLQAILVSIFTEVPPPYDDPNIAAAFRFIRICSNLAAFAPSVVRTSRKVAKPSGAYDMRLDITCYNR